VSDLQVFQGELTQADLSACVGRWVLERTPFVFGADADAFRSWRHTLARGLGVDPCDITVTGSAAAGFSLDPNKEFKLFDADSDIDVAVISEYHFDVAWRFLRTMGNERYKLTQVERDWVDEHRTRLIYWGTIATDVLLPHMPFAPEWMPALAVASHDPSVDGREVKVRLYRDYPALRSYQLSGFRRLRDKLLEE
jgi:predicted nucleotidyltransferase